MRIFSLLFFCMAIVFVVLSAAAPVFAQTMLDAGPATGAVLDFIAPMIFAVATPFLGWLGYKGAGLIGLKVDSFHRAVVETALDRAIGFAINKVGDRAKAGIPIAVSSQAVAVAADYAMRNIPGALKHFGKTRDDVAEMIEARMESALVGDESRVSPVVPGRIIR